ncbi:PIG-L family deacetylase [Phaeocystidibacter luteus]|nr:PIG-L family deacetylase [Phaeocystidibacter luteus]
MRIKFTLTASALLFTFVLQAQSSAEIQKKFQRLNSFKKVLYVAAHPDDENTRVIAWLSNGENAYVRYLSLTRGDGGQNMIGTELGPHLGILRTQELLAARSIDGGTQAFSRAVDFGYSKTADETIEKWDKRLVLGDVVWAIRKFRPDVIVTRFPPDARGGHGHHTASAMLAIEAFGLAGSDTAFMNQLEWVEPWQPTSIYWNTYSWRWDPNLDSLATHDPNYFKSDIGGYDPIMGVSYNEIGSLARSQHRCQGFGVSIMRGETFEYFQHLDGEVLEGDLLSHIETSWETIGASEKIILMSKAIQEQFNPADPAASLPALVTLRNEVASSDIEDHWKSIKMRELDELIAMCGGLFVEAVAHEYVLPTGGVPQIKLRFMPRTTDEMVLTQVNFKVIDGMGSAYLKQPQPLPQNEYWEMDVTPSNPQKISQPYWLRAPFGTTYEVDNQELIGLPENPPTIVMHLMLEYQNMPFEVVVPVDYRWSDRVDGEQRRPYIASPMATATFDKDVEIFANSESKTVRVRVKAFDPNFSTSVKLDVPEGWTYTPSSIPLSLTNLYEEKVVAFEVTPPANASEGEIRPLMDRVKSPVQEYSEIEYTHIPTQSVFGDASVRVVRLSLDINAGNIGYIQGAGDEVDIAIEQMGFTVERLSESDLASKSSLSEYKAIVIGIRAYNVHPWLLNYRESLMNYVSGGGNLIVQYNTATRDLLTSDLGPYPFALSRSRVTEEDAEVEILVEDHPYFTTPNEISFDDFEGWVQERGLYFAGEWDAKYTPLISWHDTGEDDQIGGLLFAEFGEGTFTYTGISFFRELPAGVPGAFRLLANILSYE